MCTPWSSEAHGMSASAAELAFTPIREIGLSRASRVRSSTPPWSFRRQVSSVSNAVCPCCGETVDATQVITTEGCNRCGATLKQIFRASDAQRTATEETAQSEESGSEESLSMSEVM